MKYYMFALISLFNLKSSFAQRAHLSPVHWTTHIEKLDQNNFMIYADAIIDSSWHLFSQKQPKNAICDPTKFEFKCDDNSVQFIGVPVEKGTVIHYKDHTANIGANQYEKHVSFIEKIKVKTGMDRFLIPVKVFVTYQTCSEICLMPKTEELDIN